MLSKEKIEKNIQDHIKKYDFDDETAYQTAELRQRWSESDFLAGATWASEQYEGLLGVLLTIQSHYETGCGIDYKMFTALNNAIKKELVKLKQP